MKDYLDVAGEDEGRDDILLDLTGMNCGCAFA